MDSGSGSYCGPVADLVDPYATKDSAAETVENVASWLRRNPGRWAMFSEGELGVHSKNLADAGFEVSQKTNKVTRIRRAYARLPHPEGESLEQALARTRGIAEYPADLPDLQKDSFNWTPEELAAACRAARENLFPVRAANSRRRR